MAVDSNVLMMLLSSDVTKFIFEEIVKHRSAMFKELADSLGKRAAEEPAKDSKDLKEQVEEAVSLLKDADLIKERKAQIEDFNSYYVTSDGLTAERRLRLAGTKSSSSLF